MKFMVHDRWANVLFLHWRVPPNLEPLLQSNCGTFTLDRTPDGTAWIGLILLTEANVGPPYLRSSLTCVTHHGVNVRTYVKGVKGGDHNDEKTRGIHFSSLECDDRFTAFGANFFGMPYKVASIDRRYVLGRNETDAASAADGFNQEMQHSASASERDYYVCTDGESNRRIERLQLSSVRSSKESSLINLLYSLYAETRALHGTDIRFIELPNTCSKGEQGKKQEKARSGKNNTAHSYTVECEWERCTNKGEVEDPALTKFFVERYFVYTRKYGLNWRGQVEHEPWPVERAQLKGLTISNIESYQPMAMQPLISYMARTKPDSVLFSPGVGPVDFNMLRPV